MDYSNSKCKEKLMRIFEYGYKIVTIIKVITWFL
jgi:hypothetical protein